MIKSNYFCYLLLSLILVLLTNQLLSISIANDTQLIYTLILTPFLLLWGYKITNRSVPNERSFEFRLFTTAFFIRILFAIILYETLNSIYGSPFITFGNDDYAYHNRALKLAEHWSTFGWYFPTTQTAPYDSLIAFFYYLLGPVPLVVRIFNSFIGALCPVYANRIATLLFNRETGHLSGLLIALAPDLIFWSSVQYRDILLAFLTLYLVWILIQDKYKKSIRQWLTLFLFALFYLFLDPNGSFALFTSIGIYLVLRRKKINCCLSGKIPIYKKMITLFVAILLVMSVSGLRRTTSISHLTHNTTLQQKLSIATIMKNHVAKKYSSGSLSQVFLTQQSGIKRWLSLPMQFLFPLLLPLPSTTTRFDLLLPVCGSLFFALLMPATLYGLFYSFKTKPNDTLLLYLIPLLSLIGIFILFYSGSARYKIRFLPLLWILTSVGLTQFSKWHKTYVIALLFVFIVFLFYIALKNGVF